MTTTEPRVLITAIKCDRCGLEVTDRIWNGFGMVPLPYECTREEVVDWSGSQHNECGGQTLIATEPVPSAARLSGCFSWMSTVGHGDLDEFLEDAE